DVPAGDIGVGAREIGFLYGQYKRIRNVYEGALTGKGLAYGGSLGRTEATGHGLVYFMEEMLNSRKMDFKDKKVVISGSGNVAIYAALKIQNIGGIIVAMSDSNGYIFDPDGLDIGAIRSGKEVERKRISQCYLPEKGTRYIDRCDDIWSVKCDIALPCATQNEIDINSAKRLVENGCFAVGEGANMPCAPEAIKIFLENNVLYGPGKAANAGGVATSALEMQQNSMRTFWTFEEVDAKLREIMKNIYKKSNEAAKEYGCEGNLLAGADIAGFSKVADAMMAQGVV
ncbi:MAG: NADP-specific glutamate dehydrogenase, partial [Actinobacteria bacterium]|nr:NADP-specific glutamate dehydrogenase [Actinomycetota bacterium]